MANLSESFIKAEITTTGIDRSDDACHHGGAEHTDHEGTLHLPKDFAAIGVRRHVLGDVALIKMTMI